MTSAKVIRLFERLRFVLVATKQFLSPKNNLHVLLVAWILQDEGCLKQVQ